ncbi:MAG: hypothetical protein H0V17_14090, partial [Deltaproteobacteria bacterium]|nr:hypothetical protein [Deltaproteobacteria bacterium]
MRIGWPFLVLILMSGTLSAAPKQISIKVQKAPLHDVARKLSDASGCTVTAFGTTTLDLDITNGTLWDALAKLEVDHGVVSRFRGRSILLEPKGSSTGASFGTITPNPTWTKHWRAVGSWAVALLPGDNPSRVRLVVLG